jgi:hypothetical protein
MATERVYGRSSWVVDFGLELREWWAMRATKVMIEMVIVEGS